MKLSSRDYTVDYRKGHHLIARAAGAAQHVRRESTFSSCRAAAAAAAGFATIKQALGLGSGVWDLIRDIIVHVTISFRDQPPHRKLEAKVYIASISLWPALKSQKLHPPGTSSHTHPGSAAVLLIWPPTFRAKVLRIRGQ